eukprot:CAMPEP_0179466566 /NCGR_PEP_ID=MMETSP0799-20121207/47858_1 /TAXON_ID=46947 /ORGANISM="Geminigera cryophila, Strain CCMP2564" /LENGTH=59 /DNA_ID=CAMNT_0021271429 /DNA_START=91 /DNA_END=266 /DNA_ORIENTATION=+
MGCGASQEAQRVTAPSQPATPAPSQPPPKPTPAPAAAAPEPQATPPQDAEKLLLAAARA